ncbi:hypothetical protein [Streptomyces sp. NBC_00059]|uniref:hypothetical protein n=1 Tax=Streptomyces sp. NBC_00059 TaxID=2975635 RepID=UPI0022561FA8|nr:hypothetical protein [Streptomyces sp. NBC_00059]MCX5410411.1 hypothetical protein [Streptomyces sp. NBC_00059]
MTQGDRFRDEFSRFVAASGRWRDTGPEALLGRWSTFVDQCEQGYRGDAEDYFNDLTSRNSLERALASDELQKFPELAVLRAEVEALDERFRALLLPDVFPRIPEETWWARGLVRAGRKRLVDDLRREYGVEVAEVG